MGKPETPHRHHRKKPLSRRLKHSFREQWRKHWGLVCAVIIGIITAFYVMPFLMGIFAGD